MSVATSSLPIRDLEDECAVTDDSDEEFGPPNSVDSLVFSRSPPRLSQSLSLLNLMPANVKDLGKQAQVAIPIATWTIGQRGCLELHSAIPPGEHFGNVPT